MLKANELRIGNWIDCRNFNGTGKTIRTEFHLDLIKYTHFFDPIPLTPEILEKCGFVKIDDAVYGNKYFIEIGGSKYAIYISSNGNCMVGIVYIDLPDNVYNFTWHISSLHQLQNLFFALTGEELNYKP